MINKGIGIQLQSVSSSLPLDNLISVANAAALPGAGTTVGRILYYTQDTLSWYFWNGASWVLILDDSDHAALLAVVAGLAAHIASGTAHAATAITYSAGGTVASTNVQAAVAEVASEADARLTTLESSSHAAATIGNFDSTPNAKGLSIAGQAIALAAANSTNPGGLSVATQPIGGEKDFLNGINVGSISTLGASEQFKVVSTTKGSIPNPNMTTAQKNAISSPATSLHVYDTDLKQDFFYNGTNWEPVRGFAAPAAITSTATTVTPADYRRQIQQIGGSGGAVTLTDLATTNAKEGDELVYVGNDSTNTVTLQPATNTVMNGTCTLAVDDVISFVFINSKWRERSRSA